VKTKQSGFSLTEALITVAVMGVLATLGLLALSNLFSSTSAKKLTYDVGTLNRSVAAYLASGGDLSQAGNADEVLAALKQSFSNASRIPGFSGAKIDERLSFEYQDASEAGGTGWRAYWNAAENRFVIAQSGSSPGIKAFGHEGSASSDAAKTYDPKTPLLYAESSSWIWDYKDVAASVAPGPSTLPLTEIADSAPTPPTPPAGGPSGSSATPLSAPQFSITSGSYPIGTFNLPLILANPNPAGSSDVYYSIDFGNWKPYTGAIQVPPGAVVAAQAIAVSNLYTNSTRVDQNYQALTADLLPPVISPSRPDFGIFTDRSISVTIIDLNPTSISKLQYRIGGDPWLDYTGPFSLVRDGYPSGVLVQARAVPTDPNYVASTATLRTLGIETASITGTSAGTFSNPIGDKQMETNLVNGVTSDYFEWGKDTAENSNTKLSKSWLDYNGLNFANINTARRFQIGVLDYFNGSILANTGATEVSFAVDLNLALNGVAVKSSFDFDLELVNVANNGKDEWADADFVRLADPVASQVVSFNGIQFQLQLEFGETSASGISYFNEFHVLENEQASTRIYGTLVEVGALSFNN
jgi:prepilin-type N-terminal cleavage/methylation domain-containing protein